MTALREQHLVGRVYLEAVTTLLQRVRATHPTAGLYEAADLQWWWRVPRSTDSVAQLFWFRDDVPEAAVIATDWGDRVAIDPLVMPDASPDWITDVMQHGLAHAEQSGLTPIGLEVARTDEVLPELLAAHGFEVERNGVVESWLVANARPPRSTLHEGYRLSSRSDGLQRPYHHVKRNHPDIETRLRQTSLYRPDLDLVVHDSDDKVAAYGLFWYDPVTSTGLVEPMRTEDDHQRRGLARHILTTGVDLLAEAGAQRIKICFDPDNPASSTLYLSVGFEPIRQTDLYSRKDVQSREMTS